MPSLLASLVAVGEADEEMAAADGSKLFTKNEVTLFQPAMSPVGMRVARARVLTPDFEGCTQGNTAKIGSILKSELFKMATLYIQAAARRKKNLAKLASICFRVRMYVQIGLNYFKLL